MKIKDIKECVGREKYMVDYLRICNTICFLYGNNAMCTGSRTCRIGECEAVYAKESKRFTRRAL